MTDSTGGGLSGGNIPGYNIPTGQFMFGYMPGTISYSMAVNSALSGTGIRITGMEYGLQYYNQDWSRGTLSATWTLHGNGNNVLESYYHALGPTTEGWTNLDVTRTFTNAYTLNNVGSLSMTVTGQDDRWWAGYYGPQVRNPYARLQYGSDQCSTNPLSSPTCPGFTGTMSTITSTPTATEPAVAVTTTSTAAVPAAAAAQPRSSAVQSQPGAARLDAIVRSITQNQTATQQAAVDQSQDQVQTSQRGLTEQAAADSPAAGFTRPGDPVMAARGMAPVMPTEPPPEPRARPRATQPPAELAGGISVAAFQAGVDITAYTNTVMRDAPFYAPRDIYRGQQTVDNARVLRGLGTDSLHQDMVNQQWKQ